MAQGTTGSTPVSGAGTRLMWIPAKSAFRAGVVSGTQWDNINVGTNSFVGGGENNKALGSSSFVGGGGNNEALEAYCFVGGGNFNTASGLSAFVGGGDSNTAGGHFSAVGGGEINHANGYASFVGGGRFNNSTGHTSFIGGGEGNSASGSYTFIGGGLGLLSKSYSETVFGSYNTDYTPASTTSFNASDRLFVIGNGTASNTRSNAVTVLKNGKVGIGEQVPSHVLTIKSSDTETMRLIGPTGAYGFEARLNFGDGDYVYIDEPSDDMMRIQAYLVGIKRTPTTNALEVEGNASKSAAGDWLANSDARLKKNITPLNSQKMLEKLLALQGITYEWDDVKTGSKRPEGIQYGFTAQNIREVFPTLVEEDALGYLQTAYGTYDAMTVEAIRALNDKIEKLEAENDSLRSKLSEMDDLKQRMARLEAALSGHAQGNGD
ncbi:MAG: tail fiber domain-containing protein [Lewinellaceae bacterium]|nr:tail fiber domain-containing protein [Saprospiraceae bacterium]MCB9336653.1 tail fiber domain-containing protein [Lewinellaceae bacterium]